jgi:hypothetical protein
VARRFPVSRKQKAWSDADDRRLRRFYSPSVAPGWPVAFADVRRLERYRCGLNVVANGATFSAAQSQWPQAKAIDLAGAGYDHVVYSFYMEEVADKGGRISEDALRGIEYMARLFTGFGLNFVIGLYTDGTLNTDLHEVTTTGFTVDSIVEFWKGIYNAFRNRDWFDPNRIAFKLWNEPGDHVDGEFRSMESYNGWLAQIVPSLRSYERGFTGRRFMYLVDLYPTAAPTQHVFYLPPYTPFVVPFDEYTTVSMHMYSPTAFTEQGAFSLQASQVYSKYYLRGLITWGMTKAQFGTAIQTYTCGGLYNTDPLCQASIDWWRLNWSTEFPDEGITDAYIDSLFGPLVSWATTGMEGGVGVPILMTEFGLPAVWNTAVPGSVSDADALSWYAAVTMGAARHGMPYNTEWLYQQLTSDSENGGASRLIPSRVARNPTRLTKQQGRGIFA